MSIKIVNEAAKAKAWTFEACQGYRSRGQGRGQGHKMWPRGQGLTLRTTSLRIPSKWYGSAEQSKHIFYISFYSGMCNFPAAVTVFVYLLCCHLTY